MVIIRRVMHGANGTQLISSLHFIITRGTIWSFRAVVPRFQNGSGEKNHSWDLFDHNSQYKIKNNDLELILEFSSFISTGQACRVVEKKKLRDCGGGLFKLHSKPLYNSHQMVGRCFLLLPYSSNDGVHLKFLHYAYIWHPSLSPPLPLSPPPSTTPFSINTNFVRYQTLAES